MGDIEETKQVLRKFQEDRQRMAEKFVTRRCIHQVRGAAIIDLSIILDEVFGRAFAEGMIYQQQQQDPA